MANGCSSLGLLLMDMLSILVRRSLLLNLHARTPGYPEEAKDLSKCSKKGRSDDDERVSRRLPTQKIYIRHILYL